MTSVVNISDFRNNISSYIDGLIENQGKIKIKKGNRVVAEVVSCVRPTKAGNVVDLLFQDLKKTWESQLQLARKTDYSQKVDEILYGKK